MWRYSIAVPVNIKLAIQKLIWIVDNFYHSDLQIVRKKTSLNLKKNKNLGSTASKFKTLVAEILKNKILLFEGFSGTHFIWPCHLDLSEAFWSDLACLLLTWTSLMIIFTEISWCITHWIPWTKQCCKAGTPNLHLCLAEAAILTLLRYWTFLCIIQMQCASWHYSPVHHVFCRKWDEAEIENYVVHGYLKLAITFSVRPSVE